MKLIRCRFENFRILKELEFEFSKEAGRNLTLIRAENESGKTTLLSAMQWGLFGDDALPGKGREYRLSPLDISHGDKVSVNVSVEIDYEVPTRNGPRSYRLIRHVTETAKGGTWGRDSTRISLFSLTPKGAEQLEHPEAHISPYLPKDLREVFFTDGDRALSFIQGALGDQMKLVEGAIRSLLGLGVIEEAQSHMGKVASDLNRKAKGISGKRDELDKASERISELQDAIPSLENQLKNTKQTCLKLEDLEQMADRKLSDALRKGNKEELEKQRQAINQNLLSAEKDVAQSTRDHSNLFKSETLGRQLLAGAFMISKKILDNLHNQGKIPNQTIPVLEDRLRLPNCICGETLDPKDPAGQKHREQIQRLIDDSRNSDETQKKVTALFYSAQNLLKPSSGTTWADEYSEVFERRQRANTMFCELGESYRSIEVKISELPDVDVQQLRESRNRYRKQLEEEKRKETRLISQLENKKQEQKDAERVLEKLLQQDEKGMKLISELEVAKDIQDILENSLQTMKTMELVQVSQHMNDLFLEMIGADTDEEQRSIITRAEITPDFRIIVFGRYDHPLDPSQDLNGASRRALTIAFILALTKVSEVEAPNVIDTPLGMMSGHVKKTVLKLASQQSSQLVLFLTHSEIAGCEEILDKYAGRVYTISNPAHYPKILLNDPGVNDIRTLICDCDHRHHCKVCELRATVDLGHINKNEIAMVS